MDFEKYLAKEWTKVETWEEAHRLVAEIIAVNEFLEKRRDFYKEQLRIRSAELVEAIRMLQEEGVDFDAEMAFGDAGKRVEEVKAKAHTGGELAELLNESATTGITTADDNTSVGHSMTKTVNTGEHVRDSLTTTDDLSTTKLN